MLRQTTWLLKHITSQPLQVCRSVFGFLTSHEIKNKRIFHFQWALEFLLKGPCYEWALGWNMQFASDCRASQSFCFNLMWIYLYAYRLYLLCLNWNNKGVYFTISWRNYSLFLPRIGNLNVQAITCLFPSTSNCLNRKTWLWSHMHHPQQHFICFLPKKRICWSC